MPFSIPEGMYSAPGFALAGGLFILQNCVLYWIHYMKKTIRIRADSYESPDVMFLATALDADNDLIFGKLFRLHVWLESHEGANGTDDSVIDRLMGMDGFADALKNLDCLDERGRLRAFLSDSKEKSAKKVAGIIKWTPKGWDGITAEDNEAWGEAYPACNVELQLRQMSEWLKSNPKKAVKSEWRRFITNWLKRSQERGGDVLSHSPDGSSHTLNRLREIRND